MRYSQINVFTARSSWINKYIDKFISDLEAKGYCVRWAHDTIDVKPAFISYYLSYFSVVSHDVLRLSKHNLVVHESNLPQGRGWSPLSWQVLEGKNIIPITLFEAEEHVDSGRIYLRDFINLEGHELVEEIRYKQAITTFNLCGRFLEDYESLIKQSCEQQGEPTYYSRRTPNDSRLDINKSIADQFNLLRIVDNEHYPAFFEYKGKRYIVTITKA